MPEYTLKKRWSLFLVVATGVFMSTLDSSMVNIALPSIMKEFGSTLAKTEWVVMIYLLTITVSLLFWGYLSDRLGRGRIYATGMLVFGFGSFLCAFAPGISWLILSRFGQAIGAAMMMATGPAIIKDTFPATKIGSKLGLVGMAVSLGLMTGPALGGVLIELFSWRSIFFITVPIGLAFFVIAIVILPQNHQPGRQQAFDAAGTLSWAVAITMLLLGITAHKPGIAFLFLISGTAVSFFFLRHETRAAHPILPFELFRHRFFSAAMGSALLSFMVLFAAIILIPFYLDRILALPPSRIGLVMMAIPIAVLVVSPLSGWLADYIEARLLTTIGLAISTASLLWLAQLSHQATPATIGFRLALLGFGQALFLSPNSTSVLASVRNIHAGVSSGLLATARNLGMLLGVAMAGLIFSYYFRKATGGLDMRDYTPSQLAAFMAAMKASLMFAASIGAGGTLISWLRGPVKQLRQPEETDSKDT